MLATAGVEVEFPVVDGDDVYWVEHRPEGAGQSVLVRRRDGMVRDAGPCRTRVREYGGRAHAARDGVVVAADPGDQRLYRLHDAERVALTPAPPAPGAWRYGDPELTPDGAWVLCLRERHGDGEPVDDVVAVPLSGGEPVVLAAGRDFYLAPRLSPDGRRLAWLAWDHPHMPWDAAELWVADVGPGPALSGARRVAGGPGRSGAQPRWSAEGELFWCDERTGWWTWYREGAPERPLVDLEAEFAPAEWVPGLSSAAFLPDGGLAVAWSAAGVAHLGVLAGGRLREVETPFTSFAGLCAHGAGVVCVAGSPSAEPSVVRIALPSGEVEALRAGSSVDLDARLVSVPRAIRFPTGDGTTAHAHFYAPANPEATPPEGEAPPVIVQAHGGPTGACRPVLSLETQFFTSRGFAVACVDYRGSTGYGRAYREGLRGVWGVADVEDCVACVEHLAAAGEVDPARAVIRGGSSGGYTALQAVASTSAFAAGSSHYGIGDLERLAEATHKFESRYLDGLVGPWPAARALFRERSPIHRADRIAAALILFQGLEDRVVPPEQSEAMAAALAARGLPHELVCFEGEGHGFRRAETIEAVARAELAFLLRVLDL